ncbi:MFS transporter [Streptococcus sp. SQ9-PEA]|uniref:MFS transporter n=1 Tax=Streptococcus sciuri TaxID=2973939 RepID=A0ABT2F5Z3_9STRE|nr:MFS transporter [Streptococcus sciuri]
MYLSAGFILRFSPSLWIILIISILNLLSDLLGQYENALYLPIEIQLISEEDREKIFASTQSISAIADILFKLSGAVLITWISYHTLAFMNAFIFLICALIMLVIRSKLQKVSNDDITIEETESLKESIQLALKEIFRVPLLKNFLMIIMVINGLFSIITPLTVTMISQYQQFVIINNATTIALVSTILIISNIIGNISGATILGNRTLESCIIIATLCLPLLFLSFLLQNIWLYSFILFSLGFLSGSINPKFYAFILNNLSQEKIGILTGSISTIFQIGTLIIQLSFTTLILIISFKNIIYIYLFLSIILMITTLKKHF